ncbi:hypothetical protein LINPERPRIM_LOCUS21787 [Linum perenne]
MFLISMLDMLMSGEVMVTHIST